MNNNKNVPVLLIGLGGIGSKIVDEVYGKLKSSNVCENVEALVFDTDINSQRKLVNVPSECRIQTSTDKTVKYGVNNDSSAKDWFPSCPQVDKIQMLNGAGQVRAVSRLALRSAMDAGKLNAVNAVRERLFKVGSGTDVNGLRVMIVSSMMGGTGSGMFLQIPLYIREVFESQISGGADRIEIQGTFILPDVLKGAINPKQTETIYSNAYASMKELNAIIMSLGGDGANIDLEYKPNQLNADGMRDISIKTWPYDYCYFYDKEDTKGRVLSSFTDYINMIEKNLYFQIFGPISDRMYSIYCNEIRDIANKGGRNIFGGFGLGELNYPYDDIVDFCTYKLLLNNLDNHLLKIDHIYRLELDKYNKNMLNGIDDDMPDREELFITNFESFAQTDNFFIQIKKSITEYDKDGNEINDNVKKLHSAIKESVKGIFTHDFQNELVKCSVPVSTFVNMPSDTFRNKISLYENMFVQCRQFIDAKSRLKAESKANADFGVFSETDKSILNDFIMNNGISINCIGIRYILHSIHKILKNKKHELEKRIENNSSILKNFESSYFILDNGSKVNANEKINQVIKNKGLFEKNIKSFKDEYAEKVKKHYKLLDTYCNDKIYMYYYESAINLLDVLIDEYQIMFERLENHRYEVQKQIDALLIKHNDTKGTTNHYVLASDKIKEKIWNNIPDEIKNGSLSTVLSEKMHSALFSSFQKKINNSIGKDVDYDDLFHNLIVSSCREKIISSPAIKSELNINVMEALEKECELSGNLSNKEEFIKNRLSELIDSVCPWAPYSENANDIHLWGINDKCRTVVDEKASKSNLEKLIDELSASKLAADNVVSDPMIDDRSIFFVSARYGLMVNDFSKFSAGKKNKPDGDYYIAYKNVIDRITNDGKTNSFGGMTITPHIDKRWHLTLRDINDEVYVKQMKDVAKAFILGIINENFVVKQIDNAMNVKKFVSIFDGLPTVINFQGKSIDSKLKNLYKALYGNPDLVKKVLDDFDEYCENAQRISNIDNNILKTPIIEKLLNVSVCGYSDVNNIIDTFVSIDMESTRTDKEDKKYTDKYVNLYKALFEIIKDAVKPYCFGQGDYNFKLSYKNVLENIINTSKYKNSLNKNDIVYLSSIGIIEREIENI